MKQITIDNLPQTIDEAELEIAVFDQEKDRYSRRPEPVYRDGKVIIFTQVDDGRFYSVAKDRQFLYTVPTENNGRRIFFGGMDESPFLTELDYSVVEHLIEGEESFFRALKPGIIQRAERNFESVAHRQGDFFAVTTPRPINWGAFMLKYLGDNELRISVVEDENLRGTRHTIAGLFGRAGDTLIGEGTIEAPDHEPLILKGPHIIEQAAFLRRPKEAD